MATDIYFLNKTKKQIICSKWLCNDFEDRNQIITYLANCLGDTIEIKHETEVEDIIYNKNSDVKFIKLYEYNFYGGNIDYYNNKEVDRLVDDINCT